MTRRQLISTRHVMTPKGAAVEKLATSEEGRRILRREAAALRRIQHPNVVRLLDFTDDGQSVVHLGGLPGTSLDQLHPLPADRLLGIVSSLDRIVQELHHMGWCHGRLRAEHVIVGSDDSVTLCSWSAACDATDERCHQDLVAIGAMFLDLDGHHAHFLRRNDRREQQRLIGLAGVAPASASSRTRRRTPDATAPRTSAAGDRAGAALPTRELAGVVAGSIVAVAIMWTTVGLPGRVGIESFEADPLGSTVAVVTWGFYAIAAWSGLLATAAIAALATGRLHLARRACALTPLRRTGALALVASTGVIASIGQSPTPQMSDDGTAAAQVIAPPAGAVPSDVSRTPDSRPPHRRASDGTPTRLPAPVDESASVATTDTATLEGGVIDGLQRSTLPAHTWTVAPGDHFWSIAERLAGSPDLASAGPLWQQLIELNRDRLVNPDDPDLLVPGQVLVLPPD